MKKAYPKTSFLLLAFLLLCLFSVPCRSLSPSRSVAASTELTRKLQRALVDLPGYSVFDYITFRVADNGIVLLGSVIHPDLKPQAEQAIRSIPGIGAVQNQIEVLPPSEGDDSIRHKAYERLYGSPYFTWYAIQAVAPIHIIVKNGCVALEGLVAWPSDRFMAESVISEVADISTIENHLLAGGSSDDEGVSELRVRLQDVS